MIFTLITKFCFSRHHQKMTNIIVFAIMVPCGDIFFAKCALQSLILEDYSSTTIWVLNLHQKAHEIAYIKFSPLI